MRPIHWVSALLLAIALAAGGGLLLQRAASAELQREISLLQAGADKLPALQARHRQLEQAAVADLELQRLRADHAALGRLRREIAEMQSRLEAANRPAH